MVIRAFVMVCVAVAIVSQSQPARADAAEVEALITKGNDLRREGKAGAALPYFKKAYEMARTPRTAGQLGLAELSAGYPVDALDHLATALDAPNDAWTQRYRQMLNDALTKARAQIGELVVGGNPVGAEVVVNGATVGTLPLPTTVKLAPSNTEVIVRAPGYTERRQQVRIIAGRKEELTFNLQREPKPVPPERPVAALPIVPPPDLPPTDGGTGGTGGTGGGTGGTGGGTGGTGPGPNEPSSSSSLRTAAWITGGGAVAALGTGLVLNLMARSTFSDFDGSCVKPSGAPVMMRATPEDPMADCQALYDDWGSQKRWSLVGYVSGAALAVTSGILFWVSRPAEGAKESHALLGCAPTLNGVVCRSSF